MIFDLIVSTRFFKGGAKVEIKKELDGLKHRTN